MFEQRENIKKFFRLQHYTLDRLLNLAVILGFLVMFLIEKLLFGKISGLAPFRLITVVIVFLVYLLSYYRQTVLNWYSRINIFITYWVMGLIIVLAFRENFEFYYCVVLFGATLVFSQFFRTRAQLFTYQVFSVIAAVAAILLTKEPGVNVPGFLLLFAFVNFVSFWLQDYIFRQHDKIYLAEENLKKSINMLEQLAYVVSHDLQEPIRMATSYSQLLSRQYKDKLGHEGDEFISYILESTKQLQSQVQNLLKFSRVSRVNLNVQDINLNETLDSVLDALQPVIRKHNAKIYYSKLPTVRGDRRQVAILFENLLLNSILYCNHEVPEIDIDYMKKDNVWEFMIRDNGIGIEVKNLEKIFDVFFRTYQKENVAGDGIGLAICKKVVLNHNGSIWVNSNPGEGSVFYFLLSRKTVLLS